MRQTAYEQANPGGSKHTLTMVEAGADYDGAWKQLMDCYFQPFLSLCFPAASERIDWSVPVQFLDTELQEVVRDAELGKGRADRLVRVNTLEGREEWVLIHVEVQGQPQADLPKRMYRYNYRISDRYGVAVASFAVLADTRAGWCPSTFEQERLGCRVRFDYPVCKLIELPEEELGRDNPAAVVIAAYLGAVRTSTNMPARKAVKWELTRALYEHGYQKQDILELFRLIDWMIALPPELAVEFRREMLHYEQEKAMPYITSIESLAIEEGLQKGIQQGLERGIQQGIEKGIQQGLQSGIQQGLEQGVERGVRDGVLIAVRKMLGRRLGALSPDTDERLGTMDTEQLSRLAEVCAELKSADELRQWLKDNAC